MTKSDLKKASRSLHRYMTARAAHEGVQYRLDPEFFLIGLEFGVRNFFKVSVNSTGELYQDDEQPEFFRTWLLTHPSPR